MVDGIIEIKVRKREKRDVLDEAIAKGFKGLRVTGEMACFFENGMLKEHMKMRCIKISRYR
ncbi:MAG: hypothetical protein ACPLY9_07180 [Nitrososphaerales archaeon]